MALHWLPEEFQCDFAILALRHLGFQDLAFVMNGAPQAVHLAIDLHEHLAQVPPPIGEGPRPTDPRRRKTGKDSNISHHAKAHRDRKCTGQVRPFLGRNMPLRMQEYSRRCVFKSLPLRHIIIQIGYITDLSVSTMLLPAAPSARDLGLISRPNWATGTTYEPIWG